MGTNHISAGSLEPLTLEGQRASTTRMLNRDEFMKVWWLGGSENFVGK